MIRKVQQWWRDQRGNFFILGTVGMVTFIVLSVGLLAFMRLHVMKQQLGQRLDQAVIADLYQEAPATGGQGQGNGYNPFGGQGCQGWQPGLFGGIFGHFEGSNCPTNMGSVQINETSSQAPVTIDQSPSVWPQVPTYEDYLLNNFEVDTGFQSVSDGGLTPPGQIARESALVTQATQECQSWQSFVQSHDWPNVTVSCGVSGTEFEDPNPTDNYGGPLVYVGSIVYEPQSGQSTADPGATTPTGQAVQYPGIYTEFLAPIAVFANGGANYNTIGGVVTIPVTSLEQVNIWDPQKSTFLY